MICKLTPNATWDGVLIDDMNIHELKLILAYKIYELRKVYNIMTVEQQRQAAEAMKDVHVPVVVREKKGA